MKDIRLQRLIGIILVYIASPIIYLTNNCWVFACGEALAFFGVFIILRKT